MIRTALIAALICAPLGAPLSARSPADIAEVRLGLLAVAVGDMIQENCETISPRLVRVYVLRNQLLSAARAGGFSDAEIDAFVDDPVAKADLKAEAQAYLRGRGLESGVSASYCRVGLAEIEMETNVGWLLRGR